MSTAMGGAVKGGTKNLNNLTSAQIGGPANRWVGSNYGGWSSATYDRTHEQFTAALDPNERNQLVGQLAKLVSDDVGILMLFFNYNVSAFASNLHGPEANAFDTNINWNLHEWEIVK